MTTSFIAGSGSGRSTNFIPAVPAAWSVTTIAFMEWSPRIRRVMPRATVAAESDAETAPLNARCERVAIGSYARIVQVGGLEKHQKAEKAWSQFGAFG
ncbi:hypothetical protein GCM10011488_14070 [Steroidobacter agaridevorans]|nr:hypothetical protein GCM10011488_14070 [Steroidobacter agaridevorans]